LEEYNPMPEDSLPPKSLPKEYNFPSLDLIFELTKECIAAQREQANALDSKANFVLGSATALVGADLVLQAVLVASPSTPLHPQSAVLPFYCSLLTTSVFSRSLPLLALLIVYFATTLSACLAYMVRGYRYAPNPTELYQSYLSREERSTKAEVFRAMLEAFKENDKILRKRLFWVRTAFIAFGCEVVMLVLVLLVQTTC